MNLFEFVLLVLAVYRLARLISKDLIFEWFRLWLGRKAAGRSYVWLTIAELFHCPYCLGVWFSGAAALLYAHTFLEWLLYTLAIAGGQAFLQEMVDHA